MLSQETDILVSLLKREHPVLLQSSLKWDRLIPIADYHKIIPLLFHNLETEKENLPYNIYLCLKNAYRLNIARNMFILDEFERMRLYFQTCNIPIILLKGIFFLKTIYKDKIGIRRMEDLDILVRKKDLSGADRILRDCGYRSCNRLYNAAGSNARQSQMYFKHTDDDSFILAPVHLHWHFVEVSSKLFRLFYSCIDMDEVWNSALNIEQEGLGDIFMMLPEHMLLALCEHGLRHGFARINIIYDLHSFVLHYGNILNWDRLSDMASDWGLVIPLYVGLYLSKMMLDTKIPSDFLVSLRPTGGSFWERFFIRHTIQSTFAKEDACFLLYLAMSQGITNKIRFLYHALSRELDKNFSKIF
ncbi:MAG: nucleotidyltransferase family protein [Candidatus Omnitrophica bacterium]|nr:nucleotidyltransferase family protein [Candidatus Omnitrophota bacterium]